LSGVLVSRRLGRLSRPGRTGGGRRRRCRRGSVALGRRAGGLGGCGPGRTCRGKSDVCGV